MKVITNTAISLDGRISINPDQHVALGSAHDARQMSRIRAMADAILIGGQTFRNSPDPLKPAHGFAAKRTPVLNVIVSRHPELEKKFVPSDPQVERLFLTGAGGFKPQQIIDTLAGKGVQTLLIEGGGDLIFQFLRDDLVDEMFVTLTPKLIGNKNAPSLCTGNGFGGKLKTLELLKSETADHEIFLHYRVVR